MRLKKPEPDDDDSTPLDDIHEMYSAVGTKRVSAPRQFLWFVTSDGTRDQIFPFADIRRMEPPDKPGREVAYIHFSGVSVALMGRNLNKALHRITINRVVALYEYREGQKRPAEGEAIIERMEFMDMSKATRKEKGAALN